jgi:type IV secretory pathway VirB10-like protein
VRQQRAGPKSAWTNYLIFWEVGFLLGLAITAQVTENVYDSPTGHILLIPQGTRIIGQFYNNVGFGQSRVLLVWNRLIFPNGRSIVLERQPGADTEGYADLEDKRRRNSEPI